MNKLSLKGSIWIASDIHIHQKSYNINKAFLSFLYLAKKKASYIFLTGDIFDIWIGDDLIKTPPLWLKEIILAIKEVSKIVPIWICKGNRDFLIGEYFCKQTGMTLFKKSIIIINNSKKILLSHGDEYCIQDRNYQKLRSLVRSREWKENFLIQPLKNRIKKSYEIRKEISNSKNYKKKIKMEVNFQYIRNTFKNLKIDFLVHGHLHRNNKYFIFIKNKKYERCILKNWNEKKDITEFNWLILNCGKIRCFKVKI